MNKGFTETLKNPPDINFKKAFDFKKKKSKKSFNSEGLRL